MLDRKIQVVTDLLFFFHRLDQLFVNLFRIAVENPDPAQTADPAELLQKQVQRLFPVQIHAIYRRLLCYENQLLHALCCELLCLLNQPLHRNGTVASAQLRDDTVGAAFIAAFCDLQIGIMSAGRHHTLRIGLRKV